MADANESFNFYTSQQSIDKYFQLIQKRDVLANHAIETLNKFCEKSQNRIGFEHLVDVGCGSGRQTVEFKKYFRNITAFDPSEAQIAKAKTSFPKVTNVTFRVAAAESIPVDNESADIVISVFAAQEFDFKNFLKECDRIVKPKGVVMLVTAVISKVLPCITFDDATAEASRNDPWELAMLKFMQCADKLRHPQRHILDRYRMLYNDVNGYKKSRDDSKEYDIEMSLDEMRQFHYSLPLYGLPEPTEIMQTFCEDFKKQWGLEKTDDEKIAVRVTQTMTVITFSKM